MKKSIFALAATALLVAACNHPAQNPENAPPIKTTTVRIHHYAYNPPRIAVSPGQTVTWINEDSVPHTVTSNSFTSGPINAGQKFSYKFIQPGKYHYDCDFHANMQGLVDVR